MLTRRLALEALIAAKGLRNLISTANALVLWSAAEMQDHRLDRAGRLHALAGRAYGMARVRRTDELHEPLAHDLRRALGPRLDKLVADARELDLDAAIADLARTQP